jgi:3-oxoadipate enol-lactonase
MRFVETEGGHLHVSGSGGAGRPVVFLNSLGTDLRIWDGVVDLLPGRPHLRYDKRGHGLSVGGAGADDMARHVADVLGLIEAEGLHRPVLCGVSVGGLIALGAAGARPDLISGLILCNTAARIGTTDSWNSRIATVEAGGIESLADTIMANWFSPEFRIGRPIDLAGWSTMLTRCPQSGYLGVCAAIRDTDFTGIARALSLPVHVVGGTADGATPPDVVEGLAALLPETELTMLQGVGHLPCIEAPERLARLIDAFLARLDAA